MTYSSRSSLIIAFILSLITVAISAQTPMDEAVRTADTRPTLPGCDQKVINDCTKAKLGAFISANLKVPTEAVTKGAGGLVMVEFVIEKNGKIGEVKAMHDPGFGLGAEAIRVIKLMNDQKMVWVPARDKGKKVAFRYITPVSFNLSAPPKETPKLGTEKASAPKVYDIADVMPRYSGCDQTVADTIDCTFSHMIKLIQTNLKYPAEALTNKIQGPVVVDFVIDSSGKVTNPVVTKGLGYGCDQEALRVVSLMPTWIPGTVSGKPVAVRMTLPIQFQLPKEKN